MLPVTTCFQVHTLHFKAHTKYALPWSVFIGHVLNMQNRSYFTYNIVLNSQDHNHMNPMVSILCHITHNLFLKEHEGLPLLIKWYIKEERKSKLWNKEDQKENQRDCTKPSSYSLMKTLSLK